jgi:hypothetical protein
VCQAGVAVLSSGGRTVIMWRASGGSEPRPKVSPPIAGPTSPGP